MAAKWYKESHHTNRVKYLNRVSYGIQLVASFWKKLSSIMLASTKIHNFQVRPQKTSSMSRLDIPKHIWDNQGVY